MPLVAALHSHKATQLGERMLAGSEWHDEDLVFTQPNGRPIAKRADYDDWCGLLKRAGVRHVRLHDGRHTAATLLLGEGVHPRVVMELLGHSQMRTTMDIYSHVMPALAREAADRMSTVLLGNVPTTAHPIAHNAVPSGGPENVIRAVNTGRVAGGVSAPGSHRSVREPLGSYGSCRRVTRVRFPMPSGRTGLVAGWLPVTSTPAPCGRAAAA
jgi:hypothetical protein